MAAPPVPALCDSATVSFEAEVKPFGGFIWVFEGNPADPLTLSYLDRDRVALGRTHQANDINLRPLATVVAAQVKTSVALNNFVAGSSRDLQSAGEDGSGKILATVIRGPRDNRLGVEARLRRSCAPVNLAILRVNPPIVFSFTLLWPRT
jgi:hypothetical protein